LALIAQGKTDPAIAEWKLALDINPRFSAARRNLESARAKLSSVETGGTPTSGAASAPPGGAGDPGPAPR